MLCCTAWVQPLRGEHPVITALHPCYGVANTPSWFFWDQLVLPRICKGWAAAQLNSCDGSAKTSRVTNAIQKSGDAVILQWCGLYSSLGAKISSLWKWNPVLFKCPVCLIIIFYSSKQITWKLFSVVLSSLSLSLKLTENPWKHLTI